MITDIIDAILRERKRQDKLHPVSPELFTMIAPAVLGEEVGEVNKAWLENDNENLKEELVQVAAVAVRWLQALESEKSKLPSTHDWLKTHKGW